MTRHVIAGRLGDADKARILSAKDEVSTYFNLLQSDGTLGIGIGRALRDLEKLKIFPSEVGVDLLVVAAHVHAADTRISRFTESDDSWTREIRLVIPVADVEKWRAASNTLKRMLQFLTGDKWEIGFRKRPAKIKDFSKQAPPELIPPPFSVVSLFSGGLDSLIGAIDLLDSGGVPLFVSHAGEGPVSKSQEECFGGLAAHHVGKEFNRLRVWMNFKKNLVEDVGSEDSTRGRSFLFFSLGAFAGSGFNDGFKLNVPENGLIALNVPLDPLRLGSLSTRTTHPFYMARWNDLLKELGINGRVENPFSLLTKGEMVAGCKNRPLLKQLVPKSLSCSSPTKGRWTGRKPGHCGYCLPCLIRRAALRGSDKTVYTVDDLKGSVMNTAGAEGKQIRSLQLAIHRLAKSPGLEKVLIHKPGPLSDVREQLEGLAEVYRRGLEEVGKIVKGVKTGPT